LDYLSTLSDTWYMGWFNGDWPITLIFILFDILIYYKQSYKSEILYGIFNAISYYEPAFIA